MVFIRDCDASSNVVESDTQEERWELWHPCIESPRRVDSKVNRIFFKMEMFRSYDSSSSCFDNEK